MNNVFYVTNNSSSYWDTLKIKDQHPNSSLRDHCNFVLYHVRFYILRFVINIKCVTNVEGSQLLVSYLPILNVTYWHTKTVDFIDIRHSTFNICCEFKTRLSEIDYLKTIVRKMIIFRFVFDLYNNKFLFRFR